MNKIHLRAVDGLRREPRKRKPLRLFPSASRFSHTLDPRRQVFPGLRRTKVALANAFQTSVQSQLRSIAARKRHSSGSSDTTKSLLAAIMHLRVAKSRVLTGPEMGNCRRCHSGGGYRARGGDHSDGSRPKNMVFYEKEVDLDLCWQDIHPAIRHRAQIPPGSLICLVTAGFRWVRRYRSRGGDRGTRQRLDWEVQPPPNRISNSRNRRFLALFRPLSSFALLVASVGASCRFAPARRNAGPSPALY